MTDKELKKLKRSELLEIILLLQDKQELLIEENKQLKSKLEARHQKLLDDEAFGGVAASLNAAIKELKRSADSYLLKLEEETEKVINSKDKNGNEEDNEEEE